MATFQLDRQSGDILRAYVNGYSLSSLSGDDAVFFAHIAAAIPEAEREPRVSQWLNNQPTRVKLDLGDSQALDDGGFRLDIPDYLKVKKAGAGFASEDRATVLLSRINRVDTEIDNFDGRIKQAIKDGRIKPFSGGSRSDYLRQLKDIGIVLPNFGGLTQFSSGIEDVVINTAINRSKPIPAIGLPTGPGDPGFQSIKDRIVQASRDTQVKAEAAAAVWGKLGEVNQVNPLQDILDGLESLRNSGGLTAEQFNYFKDQFKTNADQALVELGQDVEFKEQENNLAFSRVLNNLATDDRRSQEDKQEALRRADVVLQSDKINIQEALAESLLGAVRAAEDSGSELNQQIFNQNQNITRGTSAASKAALSAFGRSPELTAHIESQIIRSYQGSKTVLTNQTVNEKRGIKRLQDRAVGDAERRAGRQLDAAERASIEAGVQAQFDQDRASDLNAQRFGQAKQDKQQQDQNLAIDAARLESGILSDEEQGVGQLAVQRGLTPGTPEFNQAADTGRGGQLQQSQDAVANRIGDFGQGSAAPQVDAVSPTVVPRITLPTRPRKPTPSEKDRNIVDL